MNARVLKAEYGFIYPMNAWLDCMTHGVRRTHEFSLVGRGGSGSGYSVREGLCFPW